MGTDARTRDGAARAGDLLGCEDDAKDQLMARAEAAVKTARAIVSTRQ